MNKVTGKGKLFGEVCTVVATIENERLRLRSEKIADEVLKMHMETCLATVEPMGGTFYPDDDSLLAAYHVFSTNFFEDTPEVTVTGDIGTIPYDEETVY